MKKIFSFLCLFFICCSLSAQQIQETIYLRNGSVIKGNIVIGSYEKGLRY